MNVGDYVRTKNGCICKITNINEFREPSMKYGVEASYLKDIMFIGDEDIIKSSPDIIDLVELGDIVKIEFGKDDSNVFEVVAIDKNNNVIGIFNNNFEFDWVGLEQLKSIVTKEQFSSMEYKI